MKVKYFFAILGFIGAGMLVWTLCMCINTSKFLSKSIETEGSIIEVTSAINTTHSNDQSLRVLYKPLIRFHDLRENPVEFYSSIGSKSASHYSIGDKKTIIYNAQAPKKAIIKSFNSLWAESILVGIFGVILISIGVGFFLIRRKLNSI